MKTMKSVPKEQEEKILSLLNLSEDRIEELHKKDIGIKQLEEAFYTAFEVGPGCKFGSVVSCGLLFFVAPHASKKDTYFLEEYLRVTYYGGTSTYRCASHNSMSANFRAIGELLDGGYYKELDYVENLEKIGYLLQIYKEEDQLVCHLFKIEDRKELE